MADNTAVQPWTLHTLCITQYKQVVFTATTQFSEGHEFLPIKRSFWYEQYLKSNCKIIRKLYSLSEVLPHPLTRTRSPARSPDILRSLMVLM